MLDRREPRDAPTIADLTPEDWATYNRVVAAIAARVGYGRFGHTASGGRATEYHEEQRVHIPRSENPSSAVLRLPRGSRTLLIGK